MPRKDYLEQMGAQFDESLGRGDIESARFIIQLVLDSGYQTEGNDMLTELLDQPLEKFTNASSVFV